MIQEILDYCGTKYIINFKLYKEYNNAGELIGYTIVFPSGLINCNLTAYSILLKHNLVVQHRYIVRELEELGLKMELLGLSHGEQCKAFKDIIADRFYMYDAFKIRVLELDFKKILDGVRVSLNETSNIEQMLQGLAINKFDDIFFDNHYKLSIDISKLNIDNIESMNRSFLMCGSLKGMTIGCHSTSKLKEMRWTFGNCIDLQKLDISGLDTSNVNTMMSMLENCYSLESIKLGDTHSVEDFSRTFVGCEHLKEVNNIDLSSCTDTFKMFSGCKNIQSITFKETPMHHIETARLMFEECHGIKKLDLSNIHAEISDAVGVFCNCDNLEEVDMENITLVNDEYAVNLFTPGNKLKVIYVNKATYDILVKSYEINDETAEIYRVRA